jgi:hypothetical protein
MDEEEQEQEREEEKEEEKEEKERRRQRRRQQYIECVHRRETIAEWLVETMRVAWPNAASTKRQNAPTPRRRRL